MAEPVLDLVKLGVVFEAQGTKSTLNLELNANNHYYYYMTQAQAIKQWSLQTVADSIILQCLFLC